MIVLLPPSENKATRTRGSALDPGSLSWASDLEPAREMVRTALRAVSGRRDAAEALGVSPNLSTEIARNTRLLTAPTLPASALYTGVLYDALDLRSLTRSGKTRAARRLIVSSALYGAVRPNDRLAPYRLSMGVNLPGLGPLARFWRAYLDAPLAAAAADGIVIDCRSSTYAASWSPSGSAREQWVHVRVPGATHMAKHTRGLLTRHLLEQDHQPRTPREVAALAETAFDVALHEPASATKPWTLEVSTRS